MIVFSRLGQATSTAVGIVRTAGERPQSFGTDTKEPAGRFHGRRVIEAARQQGDVQID
jgi:hypothetical protein